MDGGQALFERLRAAIPDAIFLPSATEHQIAHVEKKLAITFPGWLRELYLCCNGILTAQFQDPYLYPLETSDESRQSLLSWNEFLRGVWDRHIPEYRTNLPEVDWDGLDVRNLLIIGGANTQDWAIDLKSKSQQIIEFEVRDFESRTVLAPDLVGVCTDDDNMGKEIRAKLYRGRAAHRRGKDLSPAANDIELLLDILIELYRSSKSMSERLRQVTSPGWSLYRGISQRAGEGGELFILTRGTSVEVKIATRDGNLPFVMQVESRMREEPFRCLAKGLAETALCVLYLVDTRGRELTEKEMHEVWRHRYGPPDEELEAMADVLFGRDDRRMVEENEFGE